MSRKRSEICSFSVLGILFAGSFIAATALGHAPASASLCGTSITTGWSTSTDLGDGSATTNETSFTASCTATASGDGSSTFAGTYEDQPATSEELDTFSYNVFAPSDETIQVDISATDGTGNGQKAAFPQFTLVLSDLDWGAVTGTITDVALTSSTIAGFGFDNVTASAFDITFTGAEINCGGGNDGCTRNYTALFTLTVEHDDDNPPNPSPIPEPASASLFLAGLAGMGVVMNRRRRKKTA